MENFLICYVPYNDVIYFSLEFSIVLNLIWSSKQKNFVIQNFFFKKKKFCLWRKIKKDFGGADTETIYAI